MPDSTESGRLVTEAQALASEGQLRNFLDANAPQMDELDLAQLGQWANQQGWGIGAKLISGDYEPAGDGAGTHPAAFVGTPAMQARADALRRYLAAEGGEPVPPPGDLSMAPNESDQWFGSTGDQLGAPAASATPFGTAPPVTINGRPNPAYQEYLDMMVAPQYRQQTPTSAPRSESAPWDTPPPDYAASATNTQQAQAQAQREAMLRQILPGNGQQTMNLPPQPAPPPGSLPPIPADIEAAIASGQAAGPAAPDDLFMDPGYHNWWGPTGNPFTPLA